MEVTAAMLDAEKVIGRPIHLSLYAPDEWAHLMVTDPVLAQISDAPTIRILPRAATG